MNLRTEQALIRINIADPRHGSLVEQRRLDRCRVMTSKALTKRGKREFRTQYFRAHIPQKDFGGKFLAREYAQTRKLALVVDVESTATPKRKHHASPGIRHPSDDVRGWVAAEDHQPLVLMQDDLPSHLEMQQQMPLVTEVEDQRFTASADGGDAFSDDRSGNDSRARRYERTPENPERYDAHAAELRVKCAA